MANTREIKTRINSVKSTAKITKALQLVSSAKMQKALNNYLSSRLYSQTLAKVVSEINGVQHPFFMDSTTKAGAAGFKIQDSRNIGILVVGTDRGFVGSMITNLEVEIYKLKNELTAKYPKAKLHGISLFKTGLKILQSMGINDEAHFAEYKSNPSQSDFESVYSLILDKFEKGELDEVHIVYSEFVNTMVQKVVSRRLLPIETINARTQNAERKTQNFTFEPSEEEVLNWLLPEYFKSSIYSGVLSSIASEYSSRMVAMKKATDNAEDLGKRLNLRYNKERQAGITQQIIEVAIQA